MSKSQQIERILVAADTLAATQDISFRRPLAPLVERGELMLMMVDDSNGNLQDPAVCTKLWQDFKPTAIFFSRFSFAIRTELYSLARSAGIPVIFHIDDNLLNVSASLGKAKLKQYNNPERKEALRASMTGADTVYASTGKLTKQLRKEGIDTHITPGDIYCSVNPADIMPYAPASVPTIGYMGTSGHGADLNLAVPAIDRLMAERSDLQFHLFGSITTKVDFSRYGDRVTTHDTASSYEAFLSQLGSLGWWIGLAPLERNNFNLCKADTKWVEYSLASIPVVASEVEVYENACADGAGMRASDQDWYPVLTRVLDDAALRRDMVAKAQQKLRDQYTHERLATQILRAIRKCRERRQAA